MMVSLSSSPKQGAGSRAMKVVHAHEKTEVRQMRVTQGQRFDVA